MGWLAWLRTTPTTTTKAFVSTVKGCWNSKSRSVGIFSICDCNILEACCVSSVHVNCLCCNKSVSEEARVA